MGDRPVRLVNESSGEHGTEWATIQTVSSRMGVSAESVRKWVRQAEVKAGLRPGASESENAEIRRLQKEVAESRSTNDILRTASAFFAPAGRADRTSIVRGLLSQSCEKVQEV